MNKVSIIIPCYNAESTIEQTLRSVVNQTYENVECVIIDDCSKDNTVTLVERFIKDKDNFLLKVLKENKGGAHARNCGLAIADGAFVIFLDSDDLLEINAVENRVSNFSLQNDFVVFPNHTRFMNKVGDIKKVKPTKRIRNPLKSFVLHDLPLPWNIMSVIWKKRALMALNGFDEDYERMQDVELTIRALLNDMTYQIHFIQPDHHYRLTTNVILSNHKSIKFYETIPIFIEKFARNKPTIILVDGKMIKYLKMFCVKWYISALLAKVDNSISDSILGAGLKFNLISTKTHNRLLFLKKKNIYRIIGLPGIRGLIWRLVLFFSKA